MNKKSNYWYATLRGGRQVYLGRDKEKAERKLEQLLSKSRPMLEVIHEYLQAVNGTHSLSSWNNRRYLLPGVARDLGYPKIDTVTSNDILAYYKSQREKNQKISVHSKIAVIASRWSWIPGPEVRAWFPACYWCVTDSHGRCTGEVVVSPIDIQVGDRGHRQQCECSHPGSA